MTIEEALRLVESSREDAVSIQTKLDMILDAMDPVDPPVEPPEPPEPPPVGGLPTDFSTWNPAGMDDSHKQGFRWKPISESDRRLVVLAALEIPIQYVKAAYVLDADKEITEARTYAVSNGRHTWRFPEPGANYGPTPCNFVLLGTNGSAYVWTIDDPSKEGYQNNCPVVHMVPPAAPGPDPQPPPVGDYPAWLTQKRGLFFHEARVANDWGVPNAVSLSVYGREGAVGNSQRPILWCLHRYRGWDRKQSLEKVYSECMSQMGAGADGVALNWETWTLDYGVDILKTMYRAADSMGKAFIACPKVDGAPGGRFPQGASTTADCVSMCRDYAHGINPWLYSLNADAYLHWHNVWSASGRSVWVMGDASRYGPATGGGFYTGLKEWMPSAQYMAARGHRMGMFIPYHAKQKNPEALNLMRQLWSEA